jgi:hypothetical protein
VVGKISSPTYAKDGVINAWAPEELRPDTHLLQRTRTRKSQKKCPRIIARKQKIQNNSLTCVEGRIIMLTLLALKQLNHNTIWEKRKYSVKDMNTHQRRQKILKCSPRSMLPTTWVPGWVLDWWGFLVTDTPAEASSARYLLLILRGAQGTGRGTYSTYRSSSAMEAPRRMVVAWDLVVEDALPRFSPTFTPAGLSSVGIGSTKLHPNSYK